jgi:phosphoglycerate dehydrogenase-like enzyme
MLKANGHKQQWMQSYDATSHGSLAKDFSLVQMPQVLATPHLGASTVEAQKRVAVEIAEQFVDLSQGKNLFGGVCC